MTPTPHESRLRRFVGRFVIAQRREIYRSRRSFRNTVQKTLHTHEYSLHGWQDKSANGRRKNHVVARRRTPLPFWNKSQFLAPPSFCTNQKGSVAVVQMPPHVEEQRLLGVFRISRDKAKSRWFSKSKSICAGWSGTVPRLCAIWTQQCSGMKG